MSFEFGADDSALTIGEFLKKRRQGRDLSLEEVSEKTKIHIKFLAAIEEGKDSELPNEVYRELFLKSYCDFLGISLDELLLRLPEVEPTPPEEEEQPAEAPKKTRPPKPVAPTHLQTEIKPIRKDGKQRILVAVLIVLVMVLALIAVQLYRGELMRKSRPATQTRQSLSKTPIVKDTVVPAIVDTSQVAAVEPEMVKLLLVGRGECWLEVSIDGDSGFAELLQEQDTLWLAMQDSISLKMGRIDNVDLWCNTLPIRLEGSGEGLVRTMTFTRHNYEQFVDSSRVVP